jgi:hypothetical protein
MSEDLSALEESAKEVLVDLRTEKFMSERRMSTGVQESSTGGVQASPSTARRVGTSRITTETRMKHRDDLTNDRLIPSILPMYIRPLSGAVKKDSVPRYFDYALVTAYLPKGIRTVCTVCTVCTDQDKIATLKFSDFNLGERKAYSMLTLHKYLMKTKGKNSNIIPQTWTHNLV